MKPNDQTLAYAKELSVHYKLGGYWSKQLVKAVDRVSLHIQEGEVLGLVGESGSGKSSLGRALIRLASASAGQVYFEQEDISRLSHHRMRPYRKQMQMVFQDPNGSLNPKMRLYDIIVEPLSVNRIGTRKERELRVKEVMEQVQLPLDFLDRYPRQLSGGQKQRAAIARAIVTKPKLLIADEPVSALDVSVQAQVLNLLSDLRRQLNLSILMISHDLSIVHYLADRVAVMYLGRIMEIGEVEDVFHQPAHPYTKALLDAVPEPDPFRPKIIMPIEGDIPSPVSPPSGCVFRTRCPLADKGCAVFVPELTAVRPNHMAACHKLPGS